MPIFRREALKSKNRAARLKIASTQGARDVNRRVVRGISETFPVLHTMFSAIDKYHDGKISQAINYFASIHPQRKVNVLSWGCGWGNDVRQLAKENPRTKVYGFSRDSYPQHLEPSKATILSTSNSAFYRYLKLKKIKFDVIYSNLGLIYAENQIAEIIKISKFLKVGGKIFPGFGTSFMRRDKTIFELRKLGLEPDEFIIKDNFGEEHKCYVSLRKVK